MSDYSFMKTGFSHTNEKPSLSDIDLENIEILLSLFITNALTNALKYVKYCDRNGVSQTDILYGLRYEVFEFLNRKNLMDDVKKATEEYQAYQDDDYTSDDEESLESIICPDSEIEEFERIDDDKINNDNREFVTKFHDHYDKWNEWTPESPLDTILKNAIDKIKY